VKKSVHLLEARKEIMNNEINHNNDFAPLDIEKVGAELIAKRKKIQKRAKMNRNYLRAVSLIIIAIGWQIYGSHTLAILFSPLTKVFSETYQLFYTKQLGEAILVSLQTFGFGLVVGSTIGIFLGLMLGLFKNFDALAGVYIFALYSTPMVALVPLITIWVGFGTPAQYLITTLFVVFPMTISVYNGVRHVDKGLLEVGASFSATRVQSWRHIVLPSAVPFIVTGLSQGVAMGMVGMFIAEISTQLSGLGSALTTQANAYHTARVLGIILIIMTMGVTFRTIMRILERRVAPWFAQT